MEIKEKTMYNYYSTYQGRYLESCKNLELDSLWTINTKLLSVWKKPGTNKNIAKSTIILKKILHVKIRNLDTD